MKKNVKNGIFTLFVGVSIATVNMQTYFFSIVLVTIACCLYYVKVNYTEKETLHFQKTLDQKSLISTLALLTRYMQVNYQSKKISNDQELIQSDPTSCPKNQKGNN